MQDETSSEVADSHPPLTLRQQQRAVTRDRIVTALASLTESNHPIDVTMASVAKAAGVSEPTLYRHFPSKKDLFTALGTQLYEQTTADVAPTTTEELLEAIPTVYRRFAAMEGTIRWNLAAPRDETVRPSSVDRLPLLRRALGDTIDGLSDAEAEFLLRGALLLTAPTSMLYWQDYLGLSVDEASETAAWLIQTLASS